MSPVTLVGLTLALGGVNAVGRVVDPMLTDGSDRAELVSSDLSKLLASAVLVGFVFLVESRPLSSVGLTVPEFPRFFLLVVGGVMFMLATSVVTGPVPRELAHDSDRSRCSPSTVHSSRLAGTRSQLGSVSLFPLDGPLVPSRGNSVKGF